MKMKISLIVLALFSGFALAQQASDYFTVNPGLRWEFLSTPLDSSGNEIDSLQYSRWDLFISEADYEGKFAKILQTKSGPAATIEFQPYLDSIFYHLSGTDGYEYFKLSVIENLIFVIDSLISDSTFRVLSFLQSLEQWYSVYRFAQPVGVQYIIFQVDTTITIDTATVPLRLEYRGTRLQDEIIVTGIGTFECKKFDRTIGVSYLIILPPPLPPIAIPILYLHDYIWIAEDVWIVQGLIPPTTVDLQFIGYGIINIPGLITRLDKVTGVEKEIPVANDFTLMQNYPNPFNPSTSIEYRIQEAGVISLNIYDVLGNQVATLVDEYKPAGTYEITWYAEGLPSGVYFYQLKTENFIETKKMLLLK